MHILKVCNLSTPIVRWEVEIRKPLKILGSASLAYAEKQPREPGVSQVEG